MRAFLSNEKECARLNTELIRKQVPICFLSILLVHFKNSRRAELIFPGERSTGSRKGAVKNIEFLNSPFLIFFPGRENNRTIPSDQCSAYSGRGNMPSSPKISGSLKSMMSRTNPGV